MKQSKLLFVFLSVTTALFLLTVCVAIPIVLRPFYYCHIGPLGLEEYTGLTREQIVTAYDQIMDYCTGLSQDFSAGPLPWSESGREHFRDVRTLFLLDLWTAALTGLLLSAWTILRRTSPVRPSRFMGRSFPFWGSVGLGGSFLLIAALASLDFDRAFRLFHSLFFPGKNNWIFDWRTDPIILLLPQEFFRNCALFILGLILLLCSACILLGRPQKTAAA